MLSGPAKVAAVALALTGVALGGRATAAVAQEPANLNVFFEEARASTPAASVQAARLERRRLAQQAAPWGFPSEFDEALGVPTFLWAVEPAPASVPLARKALIEAWGRQHLAGKATALGLTAQMIVQAELTDVHDTGRGALIARFAQRHEGLPVFGRALNVTMKPDGALVAISGYFAVDLAPAPRASLQFPVPATQAASLGFAQLGGLLDASDLSELQTRGEYTTYSPRVPGQGVAMTSAPRVRKVLYAHPLWLEPAFYVELMAATPEGARRAYSFVISAVDGATLFRNNLTSRAAYSYRVFADPSGIHPPLDTPIGNGHAPFAGSPGDVPARVSATAELITLEHGPISTGDPWLAAGATVTTGNNVDAYMDSGLNAGVQESNTYVEGSGDTRATTTGAATFDYAIAADQDPAQASARHAANVNLFYLGNWLHDWWYDHGFDEAAGNAQSSNLGRGGVESDPLIAQGHDYPGRNAAEMTTPADGASPVMEMALWDGDALGEVAVQVPAGIAPFAFAPVLFGPQAYDLTDDVVLTQDGVGASSDGCATGSATLSAPPQPSLQGSIALIDEGNCDATTKGRFAQSSGAVAAVLVRATDGEPTSPPGATADTFVIPMVVIGKADGQIIKDILAGGGRVSLRLLRGATVDRDSALDNQLVAHEYFHYVSKRLVGNAAGFDNSQGRALSEGWSDLHVLLLSIRPEDREVAGNETWQGAYAVGYYVRPDYYFGVRRVPYSTDFSRNALTLRHITEGEPLPTSAPIRAGDYGNAEVHNAGEVWATMLLECYAGILNRGDLGFEDARGRMKDYLIAGLKATPVSPSYTEARDALLAAALGSDVRDYAACVRGFARRGAGLDAVSPAKDSETHEGVVESYLAFRAKFAIVAVEYVPDPARDCDADAVLDAGEGGALQLTVRNDSSFVPDRPLAAQVSTSLPGISFADDGRVFIPPLAPGESAVVSVGVSAGTIAHSRTALPLVLTPDPVSRDDPAVADAPAETVEALLHYDGELQDEDGVCVAPPAVAGPAAGGGLPHATLWVLALLGGLRRRCFLDLLAVHLALP